MAACAKANKIRAVITATTGQGHDVMFMQASDVRALTAFIAIVTRDKKRELADSGCLFLTDAADW